MNIKIARMSGELYQVLKLLRKSYRVGYGCVRGITPKHPYSQTPVRTGIEQYFRRTGFITYGLEL